MRPIRKTITLAAADDDLICKSQTPAGAGFLDLDGDGVVDGVGIMHPGGFAGQVLVTCAGDETGSIITVYGTISDGGAVVSESFAGVNNNTVASAVHFLTVTGVHIDSTPDGAIKVGTNGVGSTQWIPIDRWAVPTNIGFGVEVAATSPATWTLRYTFDDIQDRNLSPASVMTYADGAYTSKSTNLHGALSMPCTAIRLDIESGTTPVTLNLIQSGGVARA